MAPLVVPFVDMLELGAQNARVQVVEPAVKPETVHVARVRAVVAQLADLRVNVRTVCYQRAAVAKCAEVLWDDEADGCRVAEFAGLETAAVCADPLRVVLDQAELVFVSDLPDGEHVGALAVKMHRHDGL